MLRFEEYMSYKQQVCDRLVVRGAQMKRQYGPNAHEHMIRFISAELFVPQWASSQSANIHFYFAHQIYLQLGFTGILTIGKVARLLTQ